jgi:preprotein translocase subunit SecA
VHIVTVNDYLAKRDSEWMGKIYNFLGLSVGLIIHDLQNDERRKAYACDITYGTNNEIGFDYLRDNMVIYKKDMVQRGQVFAIIDEVDSILIDEARTPLIISGTGNKSTDMYIMADRLVKTFKAKVIKETDDKKHMEDVREDYIVDEKANTATLTEIGIAKAEKYFNIESLSDPESISILHHVNQALKARGTMKRDTEYVVKDGEVIIVDEFTGRLMYGRRYSDGLHQAIEAKENVKVARESKTLATITFQNLFRLYEKLAGMTGTALTEEHEFQDIYSLDVIEIPTNEKVIREDHTDAVYKNVRGKLNCVVKEIKAAYDKGQPALIGTISIEKSEILSELLKKTGVPHQVLNAKFHEKEAEIIAQAGKFKAVTIATNMAGRGTDIKLGGNPDYLALEEMKKAGCPHEVLAQANAYNDTSDEEVLAARVRYKELYIKYKEITEKEKKKVIDAGGLKIIGTERHESRRIDNQLRGRSGRQGDPGESRFYVSLEDDLMRLFGSERLIGMVDALGLDEEQVIENRMLASGIERAQKKIEGNNFNTRKHVLQYDDVMNQQRKIIYSQRQSVLDGESLKDSYLTMIKQVASASVSSFCTDDAYNDNWDWESMKTSLENGLLEKGAIDFTALKNEGVLKEALIKAVEEEALARYERQETIIGSERMREIERVILLRAVDQKWMDHIDAMDQLRYGIGLRAYGQQDPVIEYKFEGFNMFEEMIYAIQEETVKIILNIRIQENNQIKREQVAKPIIASHGDEDQAKTPVKHDKKVGRNDPCPCGSGKKYKQCCGK